MAAGIPYKEIGRTPVDAIVLGYEAVKLKLYLAAEPHIQAQLSQLSPISLAKSEKEDGGADKALEARGRKIKQSVEESLRFSLMGDLLRGQWVREHKRWPGEASSKAKSIAGLDKELAQELIRFSESGVVNNDDAPIWRMISRLHATVKG